MNSLSQINSATEIQMDYMKLLVAQLQNQNPLEPLDNSEMASQLAQFSQLQQLESISSSFSQSLVTANRQYANSLLGKNVTFYSRDEFSGEMIELRGRVNSVFNDPITKEPLLGATVDEGDGAGDYTLSLDSVILVEE